MNITFLIILLGWAFILVFLKNTFKVRVRGFRKYTLTIVSASLFVAIEMIMSYTGSISSWPHFIYLSLPAQLLIGSCFYLLLRDRPKKIRKLKPMDYAHFLPALLSFILLWPFYTLDAQPKLDWVEASPLAAQVISWMAIAQLLVYLIFGFSRLMQPGSSGMNFKDSRWLVMIVLSTSLVFHFLINLEAVGYGIGLVAQIVLIGFIWRFHRLNTIKTKAVQSDIDREVMALVESAMQKEKLYLRPDLTLSVLATMLDLNTNKISAALNNALSTNYNDYLNQYRVKEVIRLLEHKTDAKFTLEAISRMSGFRSLTTFNTAFKKQTGKTPKQYKV